MYCITDQQQKIAMPRYYKEKIFHEVKRKAIGYHQRMKMMEIQCKNEKMPNYEHNRVEADKAKIRKQKLLTQKQDKL